MQKVKVYFISNVDLEHGNIEFPSYRKVVHVRPAIREETDDSGFGPETLTTTGLEFICLVDE